jgi:hypothetical protein
MRSLSRSSSDSDSAGWALFLLVLELVVNWLFPDYTYDTIWSEKYIDSSRFHLEDKRMLNPPAPNSTFLQSKTIPASSIAIGKFGISEELGSTLQHRFEAPETGAIRRQAGKSASDMIECQPGSFLRSEEGHLGGCKAAACTPGALLLTYRIDAPTQLTAVGQLLPSGSRHSASLRVMSADVARHLNTRGVPMPLGVVARGHMTAQDALESQLPFWDSVGCSRMMVLAAVLTWALLIEYGIKRRLSGWSSLPELMVAAAWGVCVYGLYISILWCAIYGVQDWRGQHTSASQLLLLCASASLGLILK